MARPRAMKLSRAVSPVKRPTARMRGLVLGVGLIWLLAPAVAIAQHFPADEALTRMLRYVVEDAGVPGIVLGVLEADGSTRIVSYGSAGPDARPLGPRSVFEIGSITKTFTATLLADMVARGEVALTDPVAKYLPPDVAVPSHGGRQITLLDLATHTSGLPAWVDNHDPADPENQFADYTVETMYGFLGSYELRRDPGSAYEYSNLGFQLLGDALARAAGVSLAELLKQRILDPLGMETTAYSREGAVADWMTRGHRSSGVVPYQIDTEARWGAGGLRSNVPDLLKYVRANVAPPETAPQRAMRTAQEGRASMGEGGAEVGLAWQIVTVSGRRLVTHSGRAGGFRGQIAFDPAAGIGTVVLTNTEAFTDNVGPALLLFGLPPTDWGRAAPSLELTEYVGEYKESSGQSVYVRLDDEGYLTYQAPGNVRARMYARSDSSFYLLRAPSTLTFWDNGTGHVVGMRMEMDERRPLGQGRERTLEKFGDATPPPRGVAAGDLASSLSFPWKVALETVLVAVILLVGAATAGRAIKERSLTGR